jgi:acetyl-CoA carboxylase carboxyltransferase component
MFITGPDVVKTVTGEDVTQEELGGALTHATKSGVACFVAPDEKACLDQVRELLGYLPANNLSQPPVIDSDDDNDELVAELAELVPASSHQPYDMKQLLREVLDGG